MSESEGNGFLGRAGLIALASSPRRFVEAEIEGVGKVRLRSLNELEASRVREKMLARDGGVDAAGYAKSKAALIVACLVDHDGNQLLRDADSDTLLEWDALLLDRLYERCRLHIETFTVEEAKKN